jgi:hypothetical protein
MDRSLPLTARLLRLALAALIALAGPAGAGPALAAPATAARPAAKAPPPIYALLVGIRNYDYQNPPHDDAGVTPLEGPGADVARMERVLRYRYRIPADRMVILLDPKARRADISAALNGLIVRAAATPGATVLFYYSGHGGQVGDDSGSQMSGVSSTIVPQDARTAGRLGDILDTELNAVIERANGWGVNVVTIFDSCNSGTATRGARNVHARHARAVRLAPGQRQEALPLPQLPEGTAPPAAPRGVRIHLAAAQDGEEAGETEVGGQWRGDFTEALASALQEMPLGVTYNDLMAEVRRKLTGQATPQHPHAEGALDRPFLGDDRGGPALYQGLAEAGGYRVPGGTLTGVTEGSEYDLYATTTDALGGRPIGHGRVARADVSDGHLVIEGPALRPPPPVVYLKETRHNFGASRLAVAVSAATAADKARLEALAGRLPFLAPAADNPQIVIQQTARGVRLISGSGVPMTAFAAVGDEAALTGWLKAVARYYALLDLAKPMAGPRVALTIERRCDQGAPCPPLEARDGDVIVRPGDRFNIVLTNQDAADHLVYVLDLGSDFSVTTVYAPHASDDGVRPEQLHPGQPAVFEGGCAYYPEALKDLTPEEQAARANNERDYFLLIVTDTPIPAWALAQDGVPRPRDAMNPLATLLSDASGGVRGEVSAAPGAWSVSLVALRTLPGGGACPGA